MTNSVNQVYSGTVVSKGRGWVEVTETGMHTKFGQIASNLSTIVDTVTPLQKKLADLTRLIGIFGIILAVIVFVLSYLEGTGYFPAFLLAISLAVAVVPEGLPAVMTITLAIGVKKMADKKAIIRKLSAIEALGSITLIATDKTGTLTTNKMKIKEVLVDRHTYQSSKLPSLTNHPFNLLVLNGILCSTAKLSYNDERDNYDILGDPTEGALLYLAQDVDLSPDIVKKEWRLIEEKPFDSVSKMMSVVVEKLEVRSPASPAKPASQGERGEQNSKVLFSKGAPESILAVSDKILIGNKEMAMTEKQKGEIEKQVEAWARKGLRVLAFGYKQLKSETTDLNRFQPISTDLTFLGLVAIHDAPRPEIVEAVKKAQHAGIRVIMITGDNAMTAEAVGVLAGIMKTSSQIMNGEDIERYTDDELITLLPKTTIFARTNPFQKHRIVKLYQSLGEVVAVTGDGVNDAIALKQADVGIAMGIVGTDVARETADMIITDDNFATIVNAVEEGRNIIKNLKNAIKYLLSCNISEAVALTVGLILGIPTLFFAIQLLYINLVTDGFPALALGFSPKNPGIMQESPEREMTLLKNHDKQYMFFVGCFAALLVLIAYFIFSAQGGALGKTAAFSVLTLIQSFIFVDLWLSHRPIYKHLNLLRSPLFYIAFLIPFLFQYILVSHPILASLFKIHQATTVEYFAFILIAACILGGINGVKKIIKI